MAQIYPNNIETIKANCHMYQLVSSSGTDLATGVQVLNGSLADIKSQCVLLFPISSSGTSLA